MSCEILSYEFDVTVAIISYNHSEFIEQCIDSVVNQTLSNMQIIVIDNNSNDNSVEIINKYEQLSHGSKIYNKKNIGLPAALNQALRLAKGKYFVAIAADDIMINDRLKRQFVFLESNPDFYACSGGQLKIDSSGMVLPFYKQRNLIHGISVVDEKMLFTKTNYIYSPTLMSKTSEICKDGGYKRDILIEDLYMLYKCAARGNKVAVLPYLFTLYRVHENNSHTKYLWMYEQKMKIINEFQSSSKIKKLKGLVYAESFYSLSSSNKLIALKCLRTLSIFKHRYFLFWPFQVYLFLEIVMEYAFLSIFVIVPVYIFIYRLSVGLTVNYVSFWFFNFIVFCWIGSLLISLNVVDNTYFVNPIGSDSETKTIGSILVLWGGCGPFLIFMGLFYYFKFGRTWREKHQEKIIVNSSDVLFSFSCFIMLLACFLYYVVATYPSPLIMALNGVSSTDIAIRRITVTRDLSEIANTFIISFGVVLTYFSTYSLYGLSVGSGNKFRYRFFFYFSLFVSCLYLLLSGEKAPVVYFFIGMCLLVKYCKGEVLKLSLKLILIPILLIFLVYYLLVSRDLIEILKLLSDRIFIAQVISVYLSFDLYSIWGDIGLDSINNFITKVFGLISRLPASAELMEVYFYEMVAGWWVEYKWPLYL